MKKLQADLRSVQQNLSKFRYTNIVVLLIIFILGFIISATINQPRYIVLYAAGLLDGNLLTMTAGMSKGEPQPVPIDWTKSGGGPGGGSKQGAPVGQPVPNQQNQNNNPPAQNLQPNTPVNNLGGGPSCGGNKTCGVPQNSQNTQNSNNNQNRNPNQNQQNQNDSKGKNTQTTAAICPQEMKVCPDGSIVGRVKPNCQFSACPGEQAANTCPTDLKICPDGSRVSRTGPNCTFTDCPAGTQASNTLCLPAGKCWFGLGCPADSTCNGMIAGDCISNKCTQTDVTPVPVSAKGSAPTECQPQKILGVNVPKIPWFSIGSKNCN